MAKMGRITCIAGIVALLMAGFVQPPRRAAAQAGGKIIFVSNRDGLFSLYVMNVDGSNVKSVLSGSVHPNGSGGWSPDGRRILFGSSQEGNGEIYVMDGDGQNLLNLTKHPASDSRPCWSPDGKRIAFESRRDDNAEIYIMDADGNNLMRLTNHPSPDWSPTWGR